MALQLNECWNRGSDNEDKGDYCGFLSVLPRVTGGHSGEECRMTGIAKVLRDLSLKKMCVLSCEGIQLNWEIALRRTDGCITDAAFPVK